MSLSFKTGLLSGACALALVAVSVPAYAQDDISTLRQQLDAMKERLAKLEADKQDKRRVAAAAAVEAGDKPRSWKLPGTNTSMNIGGFVKMSLHYNFTGGAQTGGAHTEGAGAGVAQLSGSQSDNVFNGGNFEMLARRSRFWIQTWTPTDWGELRTYIEGDFAGAGAGQGSSSNVLRLRHAYGTLGPVLIGKTLTLFGGLIGQPELLDDGAPMAPGALRIEQIRYTHNFGGGLTLSVALEEQLTSDDKVAANAAAIQGGTCTAAGACVNLPAATFNATNGFFGPVRFPDITAALQWNFPGGAVYVSGMVGLLTVDNGGQAGLLQQDDTAFKWGAAIGARYEIARLEFGGLGYFGYGIGNKYGNGGATGFTDAVLITQVASTSADLRPAQAFGVLGYAQYKLTDTIRVTGAFNWTENNLADEVPGYYNPALNNKAVLTGKPQNYWAAYGNLLWNPVPQVTIGIEYSYQFSGRYNSANAQINRIELAAIYRF